MFTLYHAATGKAGLSQTLNSQEKKGAFPNCSIHADRPQMTSTNCKDKSKLLTEVEDRSKRDTQRRNLSHGRGKKSAQNNTFLAVKLISTGKISVPELLPKGIYLTVTSKIQ